MEATPYTSTVRILIISFMRPAELESSLKGVVPVHAPEDMNALLD
jgi:hypothetical protein